MSKLDDQTRTSEVDAVVVGAGFAGMYMLYRLRELGLSVRVLEAGEDVGGTWYWNRYPGARCDCESWDYSYSFSPELDQEWEWTERYPTQPEIRRYLSHVADRFDLRRDIEFGRRVSQAHYHEDENRWEVRTEDGERYLASFCIMATGCLTEVNKPDFQGLDSFEGDWYHTARWPEDGVDFSDRRVGVVGTGSTGVQLIPQVAKQARELFVFQRTPNFAVPAHNRPLLAETQREIKANYPERRALARVSAKGLPAPAPTRSALSLSPEERDQMYETAWREAGPLWMGTFNDLMVNSEANDTAAQFVRRKIREVVDDPDVAEMLTPKDHPIGTKRICLEIDYFDTFNRENVTLVDVRSDPIEEITPRGVRTHDAEYELDVLAFATGFDAITGALAAIDIRGSDRAALRDKWAEGPRTYLGLATAGFPNMFIVTGPGSPSVLGNVPTFIEQHVEWIADCVGYMREGGFDRIEAQREAEDGWVAHVNEVASKTLYPSAASWYMGANVPGKPRIFMPYIGGFGNYREICDEAVRNGYEGFTFSGAGNRRSDLISKSAS